MHQICRSQRLEKGHLVALNKARLALPGERWGAADRAGCRSPGTPWIGKFGRPLANPVDYNANWLTCRRKLPWAASRLAGGGVCWMPGGLRLK